MTHEQRIEELRSKIMDINMELLELTKEGFIVEIESHDPNYEIDGRKVSAYKLSAKKVM